MNLLDFRNRIISSDPNKIETDSFFSEEITIFNILNGFFRDENILSINIDTDKKNVSVEVFSEELAKYAENSLNNQIVPGAYYPLYRIHVENIGNKLIIYLSDDI